MTQSRCAAHPADQAVDTCSRCGNFLCLGCVLKLDGRVYCGECVKRVATEKQPASKLSSWALGLSGLGLLAACIAPFAVASLLGLILGIVVLRQVSQGLVASDGRARAIAAVVAGALGLVAGGISGAYFYFSRLP